MKRQMTLTELRNKYTYLQNKRADLLQRLDTGREPIPKLLIQLEKIEDEIRVIGRHLKYRRNTSLADLGTTTTNPRLQLPKLAHLPPSVRLEEKHKGLWYMYYPSIDG
mgnify:CR=1 FL=1